MIDVWIIYTVDIRWLKVSNYNKFMDTVPVIEYSGDCVYREAVEIKSVELRSLMY